MNPFLFPSIGVDISDESFKYLRLGYNNQGVREISFFGAQDLKRGIVEAGEIKDENALVKELGDALRQYRSKYPYLVLSLPEEKGFLRLIEMQKIAPSEVRNALEFQLEEHVPMPPSEAIFDFEILSTVLANKNMMQVLVTVYPKNLVQSYIACAQKAGFTPIILELESQAVARAVVPRGTQSAVLIGDIGRTRTTFSIVWKGRVNFTSTIPIGGRDIDATLRDTLHVTDQEAADIKVGRGFDYSSEEIIKSLSPTLVALKEEAARQLSFWEHRKPEGELSIGNIYLCGGDAHLKGLPEFFSRELNVATERAKIWENLFDTTKYIPAINAHATMRYATAFGLAMRGDADLFLAEGKYL